MVRVHFWPLLLAVLWALPPAGAQKAAEWPRLERSYLSDFRQEETPYTNKCIRNVFLDGEGRLWLDYCGLERLVNGISVFQFDGYEFHPVEFFSPEKGRLERLTIMGMSAQGQLFGQAEEKEFFLLDPNSHEARLIAIPDSSFAGFSPKGVSEADGKAYLLGYTEAHTIQLFTVEEKGLKKELSLDYPNGLWGPGNDLPLLINERETWFMGGTLPLFRWGRKSQSVRAYYPPDFIGHNLNRQLTLKDLSDASPRLLQSPAGQLYFFLPEYYGNRLFQFNQEKDQFVAIEGQFPDQWSPRDIFQDQSGNICFLFQEKDGPYRAVLMDEKGRRFDYSGVVAGLANIISLKGRDFRRQAFITTRNGFFSAGIRREGLIRRALPGKWISAIAELPDGRFLVNTVNEGWFLFDEARGSAAPFQGPRCGLPPSAAPPFGKGMKQQLIPDDEGQLWFISNNYLVQYHPETNACSCYDLGQNIKLFGFLDKSRLVVQDNRNSIAFFDLNTQRYFSPGPGIPENLGDLVRDIFVDSKGILWIPTNNGLWRIDFERGESQKLGPEDGFSDFRFTSIYEGPQGRLWLGAYFGGLHIYDPRTGSITIIDQRKGLSNNAVMSILPDDDGDIWVATEHGINIISKAGTVLNSIYREDGLAYETFERFDPLKASDGRLLFGSREGISIIEPRALKAALKQKEEVKAYLTELAYFDKKAGKELIRRSGLAQPGTISIPADRPYIRLKFALSSYLEPHKNRYAYRLEGIDKDWHYLGNQAELNISRLPPGKYRLLVKGADFRNNWTAEPVAINIHAREFFYKQPWFYLLASLPFLAFGLIWARNKQLEARRLELEVAKRTRKIQEDKALIEEQARKLQQLDEMKSRFFTNISHELRTPVTLITAPLENLIRKYGPSLNNGIGSSLKLVLKNGRKLGRLVEELLELSRLEAQKASLKEQPTPLVPFCRQLFSAYHSGAALKAIDYSFHSDLPGDAHFWVDRNRLEKVINNLLSNALKFTPKGEKVRLAVGIQKGGEPAPQLLITVTDTGRGIPPEDLPHIFDRYFQTQREGIATEGGTGIGLALSKELAQLMNGNLSVESEWGQGARFCLRLPAREALPEQGTEHFNSVQEAVSLNGQKAESLAAVPHNDNGSPRSKVLIVEDNRDMQQLLLQLLADEYDCILANHGAEAWSLLEAENTAVQDIELILSDVMMPEMDGYTLLEKVKGHGRWQKLPVIMLTARAAEEDKLHALRMGVDDYLLKPFSPEELLARLANLIGNYRVRKQLQQQSAPSKMEPNVTFEDAPSADSTWLKEVQDAAREALEKEIKLTTAYLSGKVFLSDRQFARKLKALTGLTPNGYILEVKLQKARHLLENRIYTTTTEVARASGFGSASYLAKVYQEHFGKKPGDYLG